MATVTFFCLNNRSRSPTAEFHARKAALEQGRSDILFNSAGIDACSGLALAPEQIYLHGLKFDPSWAKEFRTRRLTQDIVDRSDLLVALDRNVVEVALAHFNNIERKVLLLGMVSPKRLLSPDIDIMDMDERIPGLIGPLFEYIDRHCGVNHMRGLSIARYLEESSYPSTWSVHQRLENKRSR